MIKVLRTTEAHIEALGCPLCARDFVQLEPNNISICDPSLKKGDSFNLELTEEKKCGVAFDAGVLLGTCPYCEENYCTPYLVMLEGHGSEAMEVVRFNKKIERKGMLIAQHFSDSWCLEVFESELGVLHLHRFGFWPSEGNPLGPWDHAAKHIANMFDACKTLLSEGRPSEVLKTSEIGPSGRTFTNSELHDCAAKIVQDAKRLFDVEPVIAHVWSYRDGGYEHLSCNLFSADQRLVMPITIFVSGQQLLDLEYVDKPQVFDMTEALHLAGLITAALNAKLILSRWCNETNPDVIAKPLEQGKINGKINLWKQEGAKNADET